MAPFRVFLIFSILRQSVEKRKNFHMNLKKQEPVLRGTGERTGRQMAAHPESVLHPCCKSTEKRVQNTAIQLRLKQAKTPVNKGKIQYLQGQIKRADNGSRTRLSSLGS